MILKFKMSEFFYFLGSSILFIGGIGFKSAAASGVGLYLLYSGRKRVYQSEETSSGSLKVSFIWNLIFLAISVLMLFSVIGVILSIFLRQYSFSLNKWIIPGTGLGLVYFETLFRIGGDNKNRLAVLLLIVLLISSAASYILGGHWFRTDILLGFLSRYNLIA